MMRTLTLNAKIFSLLLILNCGSQPVLAPGSAECRTPVVASEALTETERLDDLLDRYAKLGRFSGVLVVARDGEVTFEEAVGLADRELGIPNRLGHLFNLGSLTKQFTAAAILDLEARGELSVEETIAEHLPIWAGEKWGSVTIDQLLSMSSGIPSLWRRGDGVEAVEETDEPITLDELIAFSSGMDLLFEPGSRYRYSNTNYIILARIIEELSGMSWADYLERNLFERADLSRTTIPRETYRPDGAATGYMGYEPNVRPARTFDPSWGWGAGGAWSTAADLVKWADALEEGRVLPEPQLEKFFARHTDWGSRGGYYAYGWWGEEVHGVQTLNHGGTIAGYLTALYIVPELDLVVVALTNHISRLGTDMASRVAESAIGLVVDGEVDLPPMPSDTRADPALLVGSYVLDDGHDLEVRETEDGLVLSTEGAWSPLWVDEIMDEPQGRGVEEATRFVEALIEKRFEAVLSMLDPEWRAKITAAEFSEPWDELIAKYGPVEGYELFARVESEFISVEYVIGFRDALILLEVVLDQQLRVSGWWTASSVPQRTVPLLAAADGSFFLDRFRWRNDDVPVRFAPDCGRARSILIGSHRGQSHRGQSRE